jgi:serine protease Do
MFPASGARAHPLIMELSSMSSNGVSATTKGGFLSARRVGLLSGVAGLGAAALIAGTSLVPGGSAALSTAAYAQALARPAGFADLVEKVKPAVISVRVKMNGAQTMKFDDDESMQPGSEIEKFLRRFGMPGNMAPESPGRNFTMGQGSGFFMSADGYAVTNSHVVGKAERVEVVTDDGKTYSAKVVGTDPKTDLALLKVDGRSDFPFVALADTSPRIGDWVVAVGNPYGLGGTVTAGIVSARGRDIGNGPYDDFIQIDAPINQGNSGGPTFDSNGNVIGVNTAIFSPSGGSVGIGFAVPASTVKSVVDQLKTKGAVTRGWIGVQIQPVTAEIADSLGLAKPEGALVAEPQADGPAAKAGVMSGDVITTLNGEAVKDARDLARKIGAMTPGSTVKLGALRKGEMKAMSLTLGTVPQDGQARAAADAPAMGSEAPRLGLMLAPAGKVAGAGSEGVAVTGVDPASLAAERGFKTGDVILDVAGKTVSSPDDVRKALADARAGDKNTVLIRVKSGDATKFVAVPIKRA